MATARANARLGLVVAIGELQKHTGPDQRVTAPASILDTDPETPEIDGITNPNWVGVWSTTTDGEIAGPSYIERGGGEEVGLQDARSGTRPSQLAFLVSGDPDSADLARPGDAVTLVSAGNSPQREVWVPKVEVDSASSGRGGSYGYWTRDLSESVPIARWDRSGSATASPSDPNDGGYSKLLSPSAQSASVIQGLGSLSGASEADLKKSYTVGTAALAATDPGEVQEALGDQAFHTVDQTSYGLLTDTLRGGLRANFTPFLNGNGSTASDVPGMPGINDDDAIITAPQLSKFSPKFGILRSYWNLAEQMSDDFLTPSIDVQIPEMRSDDYAPERQDRTKMGVHPIITEYSVYLDLTFNPEDLRFYLMVFPRITLYNPYNVKINARPYHVQITNCLYSLWDVEVEVAGSPGTTETQTINYHNYLSNTLSSAYGVGGRTRDLCFSLEATSLEPGEALVFCPKAASGIDPLFGKSARLQFPSGGDMGKNLLSASVSPTDMTSYYVRVGAPAQSATVDPFYTLRRIYSNGFIFGYGMSLGARLRTPDSGSSLESSMATINAEWPVIQALDSDNWFRKNNGRWRDHNQNFALYSRDNFIANGVSPNQRLKFGFRLKWFQETESNLNQNPTKNWNAAPLANYDIRSSYSHRNPWDGVINVANNFNDFCYGQYAIDTQGLAWTDPDILPAYHDGKNRISPFYRSTDYSWAHTFPLFDLPRKELPPLGVAQLRHAHLSAFSFWPSFILGESYAPYFGKRESSSPNTAEVADAWNLSVQAWQPTSYQPNYAPWWEESGDSPLDASDFNPFFDVSYELNHALWDAYFMTGLDGTESGWNGTRWDSSIAMPNPRMIPNPFDLGSQQKDWMLGSHRAAKSLVIEAPFNVNNADKDAWAVLLKSFRGLNIPTRNSGLALSADQQAFPRLLVPDQGGSENLSSTAEAGWEGFQTLSDDKIDLLAGSLVREVKRRGPFLSLSDFVNRRLVTGTDDPSNEDEISRTGLTGALQSALDDPQVTINNFIDDFPMPQNMRSSAYPIVQSDGGVETRGDGSHFPAGKAAFSPGFISQGDLLAKIGHVLTARGDTFVIRAYGDCLSPDGEVLAEAYCEATVQRVTDYVDDTVDLPETSPADLTSPINRSFGRRYKMIDFRWITPSEI